MRCVLVPSFAVAVRVAGLRRGRGGIRDGDGAGVDPVSVRGADDDHRHAHALCGHIAACVHRRDRRIRAFPADAPVIGICRSDCSGQRGAFALFKAQLLRIQRYAGDGDRLRAADPVCHKRHAAGHGIAPEIPVLSVVIPAVKDCALLCRVFRLGDVRVVLNVLLRRDIGAAGRIKFHGVERRRPRGVERHTSFDYILFKIPFASVFVAPFHERITEADRRGVRLRSAGVVPYIRELLFKRGPADHESAAVCVKRYHEHGGMRYPACRKRYVLGDGIRSEIPLFIAIVPAVKIVPLSVQVKPAAAVIVVGDRAAGNGIAFLRYRCSASCVKADNAHAGVFAKRAAADVRGIAAVCHPAFKRAARNGAHVGYISGKRGAASRILTAADLTIGNADRTLHGTAVGVHPVVLNKQPVAVGIRVPR